MVQGLGLVWRQEGAHRVQGSRVGVSVAAGGGTQGSGFEGWGSRGGRRGHTRFRVRGLGFEGGQEGAHRVQGSWVGVRGRE